MGGEEDGNVPASTCGGAGPCTAAPRPRTVRSQADLPGRPSDAPRDPCAWEARPVRMTTGGRASTAHFERCHSFALSSSAL